MKAKKHKMPHPARMLATIAFAISATAAFAQTAERPTVKSVTQRTATISANTETDGAVVRGRGLEICELTDDGTELWEIIWQQGLSGSFTITKEGLEVDTWYKARTFISLTNGETVYSSNTLFSTKDIEIFTDGVTGISQLDAVLHGRIEQGDDVATDPMWHLYKYDGGEYVLFREMPAAADGAEVTVQLDGLENETIYGAALSACNSKGERVMSHTYKYEDLRSFWKTLLDERSAPMQGTYTDGWAYANTGEFVITTTSGDITANVNVTVPVTLSFDWEIDGERYWFDHVTYMSLYVDDMKSSKKTIYPEEIYGEPTTGNVKWHLEPGEHTVKWSANNAKDMVAKISNVKFGDDYQYFETEHFLTLYEPSETAITAKLNAGIAETEETVTEYGFEYRVLGSDDEFTSVIGLSEIQNHIIANVEGLKPGTEYEYRGYAIVGGKKYYTPNDTFYTRTVQAYVKEKDAMQTAALLTIELRSYDATPIGSGIEYGRTTQYGSVIENLSEETLLTELDPNTTYYYRTYIETAEGGREYRTGTFTTKEIKTTTLPVSNISNRSARFNGTVECDTFSTAEIGFQWKTMEGWLSDPRFTEAVVTEDGNVSLGLANGMLKPDTDYEFRTAVRYKEKFYYSDWETFRTELEFVSWPPTVGTVYRTDSENNCIILCGYIIPGSEEVTEYGYEYWPAENNTRAGNVTRIETGADMAYALDLSALPSGRYCIRAYAKTASGTFYGETLTFTVECVTGINMPEGARPYCRTANRAITIINAEGRRYAIADMSGRLVATGECDTQRQTVPVGNGLYIVRLDDGHTFKTIVK